MSIQQLKQKYLKHSILETVLRIPFAIVFPYIMFKAVSAMLSADIIIETFVFPQEILAVSCCLTAAYLIVGSIVGLLHDFWFTCKPWDSFPIRILNRVTLSNGAFQMALDSPIFVTYTTRDPEEIEKFEACEQVTVVAYGTQFIALY